MSRLFSGSDETDRTSTDRGQLVLVSGAVVVVALLTIVLVHAQLGYAVTDAAPPVDDVAAATDDAVEAATADVAGRYSWAARESAVADFRSQLDPSLTRIEHAHTGSGGVSLSTNNSVAAGWALRNCPESTYRDFGQCVADDGVVVQERAGETAIVAALVDVRIGTPQSETDLTFVFRPE
ncbi:hypothetical protein E6P09_06005 [Haloferax mediterranei ATCC 33500]|uniref:Uncharacterized protein n=1 Tax=Haloferax mediterranei (strain ATCC 33500 / DSM 1411 / JCM 8866 / NBRC 14739 / NCIMB 2177 / R-4) TaxID=523841 RepID=I3R258_HALMT|nr:hypothetical protein [Haloferax mediterranei]AFK18318.1 hypothetical protein HFX_0593 [Haloferax mediterranei ATCC 33500]AHZ22285.1 hypothetical protein BM92_06295 [Haloferax mediterranei ATCC 33500]EMA02412.1 hypothetical protein C439_07515 [Haloferax mediterranei ATCC 33500]MDX5988406.1 hypothetical protein [Haloferax mediterranei ATCC 33500]QCQ74833.1 hypothetical protein E6P09_06005 [Haloferax mediterranei ATCC 33500]